jgi:deoxyribodipyrimidine photolyase-like uncharacterized protein
MPDYAQRNGLDAILLAGLNVDEVCSCYLGVFVDAFEWVELPGTLGTALYADEKFSQ